MVRAIDTDPPSPSKSINNAPSRRRLEPIRSFVGGNGGQARPLTVFRHRLRLGLPRNRVFHSINGLLVVEHVAVWKCLSEPLPSGFTYHGAFDAQTLKLLQLSQVINTLIGNRVMSQSKLPKFVHATD